MRTSKPGSCRLPAFLLVTAALMTFAVASDGATLKHKKTGEIIKGKLLSQKINNLRVFRIHDGGTKFINPDDWEVIEADKPAAEPQTPKPDEQKPAEPPPETTAAPAEKRVYFIPISGPIQHPCLVEAVDKALKDAKLRKATVVLFRMNTPGGLVHVADKIIRLLEGVDWATTISWVEGDDKQALSAGAYICLATHKIFMAPGTTIGAATPYRTTSFGSAEVDEKFTSAFRARFRSLAQQRGHSAVIADAMVDRSLTAVQVRVDGKQRIVTEDEARSLEREHDSDNKYRRGKTITRSGKLLTLTDQEAKEFGVCHGIAATKEELMEQLGHAKAQMFTANWLPPWVKTTAQKRDKTVETYRTLFSHHYRDAMREDPHHQTYYVGRADRTFDDFGQRWREYTDRCLGHLKKCAAALNELEKLSKDERYNFPISEAALNKMKMDMETTYTRLRRERSATRIP